MAEYGLTEASTGISVGSQPPLIIPSTQPADTSPYQPIVNSINVALMRTQSAPSNTSSPHSTKKRLSLISSETASSIDSSSSSGVYDLNLHATDEDVSLRGSTPLEEKLSKSNVKRNKVRKISLDKSPLAHSNSKERLAEKVSSGSKENLSERRRSSVEETLGSKQGKEKFVSSDEDKKGNTFSKQFSFLDKLSERERSRSIDDTYSDTPVTRRSIKEKDINNTVPRRRSLIERISIKSHMENTSKRRNSLETPNLKNGKGNETDEGKQKTRKGQITEVNKNAKYLAEDYGCHFLIDLFVC